jgi:uncharacterized protein YjhX (UPF0386 family)
MDTSKTLRAKLRDALKKWHDAALKVRAIADQQHRQRHDLHRGDEAQIMSADRGRRISVWLMLAHLAADEEIGALVMQLDERRPLKLVGSIAPPENPNLLAPDSLPPCEWTIARPGRESPLLPHTIGDPLVVWDIVVEAVVPEWIDHLADDAPSADGLIPEARLFLKAMLALGLHDGKRGRQEDVWERVAAIDEERQGKKDRTAALKLLKDRKLVDSLSGTGTTLTDAGLKLARSLK